MTILRAEPILRRLRDRPFRLALETARAEAAGRGLSLYLVGGCVRDLVLGRRLVDLDLVVEGEGLALARALARRWQGQVSGPSPFGTCRVVSARKPAVDIAVSRRERYPAPAALPRVEPAAIQEDLLRRDFTVNSMAICLEGALRDRLLDPSGGLQDARRRLLRPHHPRTLVDDPTRAIRGARYAVRLGLRATPQWAVAIRVRGVAGAFRRLTGDRLRRELVLAGRESHPAAVLRRLADWELLGRIHPRLAAGAPVARALHRAAGQKRPGEPVREDLFLALLAWGAPPRARASLLRRLGLRGGRARLLEGAACAPERAPLLLQAAKGGKRAGMAALEEMAGWEDLVLDVIAAAGAPGIVPRLMRARERWARGRTETTAKELLRMGVPEGPLIGRILRALREGRVAGRLRSRGDESRELRRLLGRERP